MSFVSRSVIALLVCGAPAFAGQLSGVANFDQVDTHVYRGGQPTGEGFQNLAKLGVKTIIDLREAGDRSKAESQVVTASGMKYVNVPMTGLTPPTVNEITQVLGMLEDSTSGPVFVHCQRGADRTGAVIAAYHIDRDKWDNARALNDAKAHGMGVFQFPRENYIKNFRPLTIDAKVTLPAAAALPATATPAPAVK